MSGLRPVQQTLGQTDLKVPDAAQRVTQFPVRTNPDSTAACHGLEQVVRRLGWEDADRSAAVTILSELTRNILRYAALGSCTFWTLTAGAKTHLYLEVTDRGPGIADPDKAMTDGFTSGPGLGIGLPGVRRLADGFRLDTGPTGTTILVELVRSKAPIRRSVVTAPARQQESRYRNRDPVNFGFAWAGYGGLQVCGDWGGVWRIGDSAGLLGLSDALGHGPEASETSRKAIAWMDAHRTLAPEPMMQGLHKTLAGSRGAALALAHVDLAAKTFTFLGVGNVRASLLTARMTGLASQNGIVGDGVLESLQPTTRPYNAGDILAFWSDGLPERLPLEKIRARRGVVLQRVAEKMIAEHASKEDDASIVLLRLGPGWAF
ncbi:MAG: ATP-binding protein [Rhodospirillaceae bacterium]